MTCTSCGDDVLVAGMTPAQTRDWCDLFDITRCYDCEMEIRTGRIPPASGQGPQLEPLRLRYAPEIKRRGKEIEEPNGWQEIAVRELEDADAD